MKIKKLLLLIVIFLITGCSADYTVVLNEDSSINEKAIIYINDNEENYNNLISLLNSKKDDKKNYKITRNSDEIKITYNNKYNTIESYIQNSYMYKQLSNSIDIDKNNKQVTIKDKINLSTNSSSINKDNIINFDTLTINVDSKLPIINSNADSVNKNVYTWNYDKNQQEKEINFKYKTIPNIVTYKSIITIALMIVSTISILLIIYRRIKTQQHI